MLKELVFASDDPQANEAAQKEKLRLQLIAKNYAGIFNTQKPTEAKKIDFLVPKLYDFSFRQKATLMLGEDQLEIGKFLKYNNHRDYVRREHNEEDGGDNGRCLQAFSHFTYEESNSTLLVCDLQGCWDGEQYRLTDPMVHMAGGRGGGKEGIDLFFAAHECNEVCREMGLKPHPKQREKR